MASALVPTSLWLAASHPRPRLSDMRALREGALEPGAVRELAFEQARNRLQQAWHHQSLETRDGLGIVTNCCEIGCAFRWRNFLSGVSGYLLTARYGEVIAAAVMLLDEMAALRRELHA